jgi:transposase
MMRTAAKNPEITSIPVPLSETEFTAFIFPHLALPKRGPQRKLGYHRLFNLILWVLYTGMPWQCLPIAKDATGKPEIHDPNIDRAFATWADDGSLQQAFMASVAPLADETTLDLRVLPGDGTNTVAQKGGRGLGTRGTNTRKASRSSP